MEKRPPHSASKILSRIDELNNNLQSRIRLLTTFPLPSPSGEELSFSSQNKANDQFEKACLDNDPQAICNFINLLIKSSFYPADFDRDVHTNYDQRKRLITVRSTVPPKHVVPAVKQYTYAESRDEIKEEPLDEREFGILYSEVVACYAAYILRLVYGADPNALFDRAIFNGHAVPHDNLFEDKSGPFLLSVQASRKEYDKYLKGETESTIRAVMLEKSKRISVSALFLGYPDRLLDLSPGAIVKENLLPLPSVYYPNLWGVFIAFSPDGARDWQLCSCAQAAVDNYWSFRDQLKQRSIFYPLERLHPQGFSRERNSNLDWDLFPPSLAERLWSCDHYSEVLRFTPNLCHKCNNTIPTVSFCSRDGANVFVAQHGWYINQAFLTFGLFPHELGLTYSFAAFFYGNLPSNVPGEIASAFQEQQAVQERFLHEHKRINAIREEQLRQDILGLGKRVEVSSDEDCLNITITSGIDQRDDVDLSEYNSLRRVLIDLGKKLSIAVENMVRLEFREPKVGEGKPAGESAVFRIVCELFPTHTVLRNQFPEWLGGLELDIYVPQLALAIEYQGEQHYLPISAWGGHATLNDRRQRDQKKSRLCKENGVTLICIDYDEPLTNDHISGLLRDYLTFQK